jgi:hypothetical protein
MSFQQPSLYLYDQCESYFVEAPMEEQRTPQPKPQSRAERKLYCRERQYQLADELSRLTSEEYQDDILDHMEQMEVCSCSASAY